MKKKKSVIIVVRGVYFCTVDGIIDGKPARNDRGSLTAQQRVNVNVNFPYGIISTVCVVIQHCDLQRLILQVLVIDLSRKKKERGKKTNGGKT